MPSSSSNATFIQGDFWSVDLFYSPYHATYIIVYLRGGDDAGFHYRYLATSNSSAIVPFWVKPTSFVNADGPSGSYVDIAEELVRNKWSKEHALHVVRPGSQNITPSYGGVQLGYFDEDDIANGGKKMLLIWNMPVWDPKQTSLYGNDEVISTVVEWK